MIGIGGLVLVLVGVFAMAWSRRVGGDPDRTAPLGLAVFVAGCASVAVGAVLVTEWWLES